MSVNQLNLQHSLQTYLASAVGVKVVWIYDGVVLPTVKPFVTVEQMQNNNEIVAKMREAVATIHRFQVGLYASSASERSRMQTLVSQPLMFGKIPLIDTAQPTKPIVGYFYADVTNEVPIPADSTDEKTKHHLMFFDIEIDVHYYG